MNYRADIDGLRAVAVTLVILFHYGFPGVTGGYIGVDVFFVVSGFLITRLIAEEYGKTGHFNFLSFYVRRARRLFPSLFFTLCVCMVAAIVFFTPEDLERFGGSLVNAALGLSNFYFWRESGYFDVESATKPLLHTWSLGVEEQFYLIWPFVLIGLLSRGSKNVVLLFLLFAGAMSLIANFVFSDGFTYFQFLGDLFSEGASTIFYLAPFRVFEFAIGAGLVFLGHSPSKFGKFREAFLLIGLSMIAYAVTTFDAGLVFPSYHALIPCIGTALAIYGGTAQYSGCVLRNRALVGVGLISYSAYLIHWPVIVFYKYLKMGELNYADMAIIIIFSLTFSAIAYKYIEQPFRRGARVRDSRRGLQFGLTCAMLTLLLLLPASNIWANGGWPWRLDRPTPIPPAYRFYCGNDRVQPCKVGDTGPIDTVWIGDSLTQHYISILADGYAGNNILFYRGGCPMLPLVTRKKYGKLDESCTDLTQRALATIQQSKGKNIVVAIYWGAYFNSNSNIIILDDGREFSKEFKTKQDLLIASLTKLKKIIDENGHRLFLVDHVKNSRFKDIYRCLNTPLNLCRDSSNVSSYSALIKGRPLMAGKIQAAIKKLDIQYYDTLLNFCDEGRKWCELFLKDGNLVLRDQIHFTR